MIGLIQRAVREALLKRWLDCAKSWIVRQNIARFSKRLQGALGDADRRRLERRLAMEERKLRELEGAERGEERE
jgi:hypothetical protein